MEPLDDAEPFEVDTYDLLGLEGGGVIKVHGPAGCGCGPCVIHSPSQHHMRGWRIIFRTDQHWLAERQCPHGYGHPDPDSLDYLLKNRIFGAGIHSCDGCCKELA